MPRFRGFAVFGATCQSVSTMTDPATSGPADSNLPGRPPVRGGGCLIAAGLIIGPTLGLMVGQTSAGLVIGGLLGIAAAIALAFVDGRKP
jgi:hypothetical protein